MNTEELYQLSFQLILHSGNARSFAMEAIQDAKKKDFHAAKKKLTESDTNYQRLIKSRQNYSIWRLVGTNL
ncbi:hypothetical protein BACSP_01127 [Bacillus sp. T2.9-1]|nr:hypothetical protein BACSP_01127 [Bacillus sp. T2.9-1]